MARTGIYTAALMEHNAHPDYKYELADFTHEHEGINPSCGDEMVLRLRLSDDGQPPVSLSVGVAFADRENPQGDILHDADTALYRMKEVRRCGCAVY